MPVEISVALNRSQARSCLSYDRLHVLGRPVMKTLLELRNDGGAEVNRACVRASKMIATQTRPSQEEFIGSLSRRRGKRTTFCRAAAGRHATDKHAQIGLSACHLADGFTRGPLFQINADIGVAV